MKLYSAKLFLAGLLAVSLPASSLAATFWDSTLTVQGQTLDLGAAGRTTDYAGFTTDGNFNASGGNGEIDIVGNVGVNGNLTLSNSVLNGDATIASSGHYNGNRAQITGSLIQSKSADAVLAQGRADASTFTSRVMKLNGTSNFTTNQFTLGPNMNLNGQTVSITATDNNPVVLKLSAITLNNSTVTLNGSSSEHYIIDISGNASLNGGSKLLLGGGLQAGNVVIVLEDGNSNASLTGGSLLNSIVLAANRNVALSGGSEIDGELIAKSITLSGGSKIKKPKKPSP